MFWLYRSPIVGRRGVFKVFFTRSNDSSLPERRLGKGGGSVPFDVLYLTVTKEHVTIKTFQIQSHISVVM
jgi:hypothetical protein